MTQEIFERRNSPVQIIFRVHTSSFFKFKRLPWQEENRVDKVVVQPYLLLVEASESFEKAELAAKEAPTDALDIREENLLQMVLWKTVHFALFLVKISINFSPGYSTVFFFHHSVHLYFTIISKFYYKNFKIFVQCFNE
jgi:hypothetical protein